MDPNETLKQVEKRALKKKLNHSHIQGFIAGVGIMAILITAVLFIYKSLHNDNQTGTLLQSSHYGMIENFDAEVLNAPGQTLVFFNNSSINEDHLAKIFDKVYQYSDLNTKIFDVTKASYGLIEGLGLSRYDLPVFAIFGNGRLLSSHKLDLEEVSVVAWLDPFNEKQPRIYRAFPSSAYDSVGSITNGYYVSELCLMPEVPGIRGFIKLSDNMTLPLKDTTLFALLTDQFGGDKKTYFGLPDLDAQIPAAGLKYYMADGYSNNFPTRDADMNHVSYVDGNIKYLEFSIEDLNQDAYIGNIILAKNIDETKIQDIMLPCDGRLLNVTEYPALASIFGNRFGSDGVNSFRLPDLSNVVSPITGAKYYMLINVLYPVSE